MQRTHPRGRRRVALVPWLVFTAPIAGILLILLVFFSPLCTARDEAAGGVSAPPPGATLR